MNGSNGDSPRPLYTLPDELFTFTTSNGQAYSLDIIDCHLAQNRIADESASHTEDQFWFLRKFAEWVAANGGPPQLRLAQVDALWFKCREEFAERKKAQNASLQRVLSSPSSTASTPEEPDPADPLAAGN